MDVFTQQAIIPDALDAAPQSILQLKWAGSDIAPGSTVTPAQTADPPTISWPAEDGALYAFILFGLDAPTRQDRSMAEVCLWCVANIPGSDIGKGEVMAPYTALCPQKGTGSHRYIALVFKQPGPVSSIHAPLEAGSTEGRARRSVRRLSAHWKLDTPVAGTCFNAEYDSTVDARMAAMTGSWE